MDNYTMHSGRRSDLGARLRPSLAAESLSGPAPYPNPSGITMGSLRANTWGRVDGARESAHSLNSSSRHHRLEPSDVERPTSPAFMKLLSQRSPKAPPSEGSRSPSVMSQISGRRRVSSPAIAARAWLGSSSTSLSHAPATPVQAQGGNTGSVESGRQGTETDQDFTVLSRSRGRSDKKKNRDESTGHRGRSTSSQRHGHRKSLSKSKRETEGRRRKEGTVLSPTKHAFEELSRKGSSRPPPKKVISPRHLPPPTFEKILLGLIDDDFTSGNDEVDVFGAESKQRDEAAPFETLGEEECVSVSVEHTDCMQDEVHSSASFSPHSSRRSSLENRCGSQAQQDGVIPEHFLYIPPLRLCGNSAEEKRPVPALMHPTDDEAQVSVREDRRHIATLFSLEAAESQAQKARLQEQLKATSPFRLTEVGGSSASQSDGVEIISPPPGKSKRRERSTLLETIVREHDWESEEQTFEENIHIYPEQQEQAQNSETLKVSQWQFFTSDEEVEVESPRGKESDAEPSSPRACEQESDKGLDGPAPAAQAGNSPELPPEECGGEDVPGAFDAVWGRSASPSQGANDSQSKASSNSDNGENLRELYSANTAAHRMSRMVDFLSAASLHSEDGEAASGDAQGATAPEKDSDAASSDSGTATEGLMKTARAPAGGPATVQLDEDPGKVPLLRLGDPREWEVRYSTDDDLPNSVEQSPFNCEEARSADSATQEDTEQRSSKDQGQTVEFEEEQDLREDTYTHASRYFEEDREASSSRFPEEPPSTACRGPAGGPLADSTRMSSYSSTRLASVGNCEQSRSGANEAPPGRRVTKELQLAAATLDTRLRSVQSITSEDAPTEAAVSRRSLAVVPHILKSASRKRQRTLEEEGAATGTAPLHPGGRADEERKVASETKYVLNSTAQAFLGVAKNCLLEQSQVGRLLCSGLLATNRVESPTKATGAAAAAAAEADDALETERPWTRMKDPRQADVVKLSEDIITVEADAWHEGSTAPAHDAEKEEDGEDTSRPGNGSLCEADFSGPFNRYSDSLSPCRTSVPATTRSIEAFEAISRAISGCAYGPRLHLLILSCMFLAVWALLLVLYLFDGGRGPRFFVGFAVALSFVLSLCTGALQLTASLFKWKALKCSLDLDLRERIFASLKRLRPAEDGGDPLIIGMGDRGNLLQLVCNSFVDSLTQGSPSLYVSRAMERRFIATHTLAGLVAAAFIAGLVCSGQKADSPHPLQFQAGDAVAVVAAFLYSILLLALSYYLAKPPTQAALRRAVEMHSAFHYLWSLKFVDFLLDRRAVSPRSVQGLHLPAIDTRHSCLFISSINPRLLKQEGRTPGICFRGISNPVRSKYMTAKAILRHATDVHFSCLKDLRTGQRVLLTLASAPRRLNTNGSTEASSGVYLSLLWCGSRSALEELRILLPPEVLSPCSEAPAAGREEGGTSTSLSAQHQRPQDVLCTLLGMMQEESTDSFVNSHIRRHLSTAETQLSSASCKYPLVLHIPKSAFNCGKRRYCYLRALKGSTELASSCCMLRHFCKLGRKGNKGAGLKTSVSVIAEEQQLDEIGTSKDKQKGGKPPRRVGPWKVHDSAVTHTPSVQMHAHGKHVEPNTFPTAAGTQQAFRPRAPNDVAGASEMPASLTLLFNSEEQLQEFRRCIQEATST